MQATHDTRYNHQLFVLGRESRGISQSEMAHQLGISQGKLSKLENGLLLITDEEAKAFSKILGYPLNFFQRNEKVYGVGLSEFFHRKKQAVPQKQLMKIYARLEIRRIEINQLLKSVDIDEPNFPFMDPDNYDGDIERIAQTIRATWLLPRGPIENVIDVIEEAGGIVVPFDFEGANIDAICLSHPGSPPLIFTNFDRPSDRIRFTLSHELGHIIMHRRPPSEDTDIELQADRFASEFLMPKSDIASMLGDLTLTKLASLKPFWKVSMGALLVRAKDLGKITERQYRYLWTQMGKAGYRTKEPEELAVPKEEALTLSEIINIYQTDLKYSRRELSSAVALSESEFNYYYSPPVTHLRRVK